MPRPSPSRRGTDARALRCFKRPRPQAASPPIRSPDAVPEVHDARCLNRPNLLELERQTGGRAKTLHPGTPGLVSIVAGQVLQRWKVSQIAQAGEVQKRAGCDTQARLVEGDKLAHEQGLERAVTARAPDAFDAGARNRLL